MVAIVVTGAGGVLGTALVRRLRAAGEDVRAIRSRADCDLEDTECAISYFKKYRPQCIYHLAGAVYGVGGNVAYPADIFRRNTLINCNTVEAARQAGVSRILCMGTVAMYADGLEMPIREDDLMEGQPHSSERFYAFAKRGLLMQLESYKLQFGLDFVMPLATNLYGPGDRFDANHGHVVPSLVRKFVESGETGETISVWGDGSPTRDLLFSDDAAEGLVILMQRGQGPYNLATGSSISIRSLVETLSELVPDAKYHWDTSKPLGQLRRSYDVSKLAALGFQARTSLIDGLSRTITWFRDNRDAVRTYSTSAQTN